jgi:hypothetical protein
MRELDVVLGYAARYARLLVQRQAQIEALQRQRNVLLHDRHDTQQCLLSDCADGYQRLP